MAVGTTNTFDVSRNGLVRSALKLLGVKEPSQDEMSDGVESLNYLMRFLDETGDWLHAISNTPSTLTLIGSQAAYAAGVGASLISPNILSVVYAAVVTGTTRDPLRILDTPTSIRTPLKDDSPGQPVAVHLEEHKNFADKRMFFYPTPNSAYTIEYNFRRPLYDFTLSTDNPDVPAAFLMPLKELLACKLAPEYGNPLPERQLLLVEAQKDFDEAKAKKSEPPSYQTLKTEFY